MLLKKVKSLWPIFILPLLLLLFFGDTLAVLHRTWIQWDQAYSHGYLIVGLFLFWVTRATIAQESLVPDRSAGLALVCFLGMLFAWYAGRVIQVRLLEQLAVVALGWCYCWTLGGYRFALKLLVPFLIVLLAIPLWDVAISPLQDMTVTVVTKAVEWAGIAAFIDGNRVSLPYGDLVIADGCAGLNLFLVSLTVGSLYSYLYLRRPSSVVYCIGVLLILGIATNWVRVFSLVVIGYYSKMQSSLVEDHGSFGWMMFAVVLLMFFLLYRRVEVSEQGGCAPEESAITIKPTYRPIFWVLLLLMSGVYWWTTHIVAPDIGGQKDKNKNYNIYSNLQKVETVPWKPNFSGFDFEQHWQLPHTEKTYVSRYVYLNQEQGKELIYYSNEIADKYRREIIPVPNDLYSIPINAAKVQTEKGVFVVIWSYKVGPWFTASELRAKLLQLPTSFLRERSAELLVIYSYCGSSSEFCRDGVQLLKESSVVGLVDQFSRRMDANDFK